MTDFNSPSPETLRRLGLPTPLDIAPLVDRVIESQRRAVEQWLASFDPPVDPDEMELCRYPDGDGRWGDLDVVYVIMPKGVAGKVGEYGPTREEACERYPYFLWKTGFVTERKITQRKAWEDRP